jgi:hypothetical protein
MLVSARHKTICEKQLAQTRHSAEHPRTKHELLSPILTREHLQQVGASIETGELSESVAFILFVSEASKSDDIGGISVTRRLRLIWESDQIYSVYD